MRVVLVLAKQELETRRYSFHLVACSFRTVAVRHTAALREKMAECVFRVKCGGFAKVGENDIIEIVDGSLRRDHPGV